MHNYIKIFILFQYPQLTVQMLVHMTTAQCVVQIVRLMPMNVNSKLKPVILIIDN